MSRWIRLDTSWSSSEWVQALPAESRLAWVELLCYAKAHGVAGRVRRAVGMLVSVTAVTRNAVQDMESAAIQHGSLVVDDDFWILTGWQKYQSDETAAERMRRHRADRSRLSPLRVTGVTQRPVTAVTSTETETETETNNSAVGSRKRRASPPAFSPEFCSLWAIHPRGAKAKAYDEYRAAVPDRVDPGTIRESLARYVAREINDRFLGHDLFRWIRDGRWEGYLASRSNGNGARPVLYDRPEDRRL